LDLSQIGHVMAGATAAEVANLGGLQAANGAGCHEREAPRDGLNCGREPAEIKRGRSAGPPARAELVRTETDGAERHEGWESGAKREWLDQAARKNYTVRWLGGQPPSQRTEKSGLFT
jgi:hypothetical protein